MSDHMAGRKVSASAYRAGCRCDGCRAANTVRPGHAGGVMTRRLRALRAWWQSLTGPRIYNLSDRPDTRKRGQS